MRNATGSGGDGAQDTDLGMPEPVAYAYLSAATDFHVSQVVDRTVWVHATIRGADFPR